jgi:hypothetical protein
MTPEIVDLIARFGGAAAGGVLALVFAPPRSKAGFVRRSAAALICGSVFANYARTWVGFDPDSGGMLAAACLTGFASWGMMGAINRAASAWQAPRAGQED